MLEDFEFDIKHISGKSNKVADHLSRYPLEKQENLQINSEDSSDLETVHSSDSSDENRIMLIEDKNKPVNIENHQLIIIREFKDNEISKPFPGKTRHTLYVNGTETEAELQVELLKIMKPKTTYGIYCSNKKGIIPEEQILDEVFLKISNVIRKKFYTNRLKRYYNFVEDITDKNQQAEIFSDFHIGKTYHRGSDETYEKIKLCHYWPNMLKDIKNWTNKCETCLQTKYDRHPSKPKFQITPTPDKPFSTIMMDTIHINNNYIYFIIDIFSRKIFTKFCNSNNQVNATNSLIKYLETFPKPEEIITDNGREYDNLLFKDILNYLNIRKHETTPYNSNSLGTLNRASSSFLEILRTLNLSQSDKTDKEKIKLATIIYNNSMNHKLKLTPNEIIFGKNNSEINEHPTIREHLIKTFHENQKIIHQTIKRKIEENKKNYINKFNQNRDDVSIITSGPVAHKIKRLCSKTGKRYELGKIKDKKLLGKRSVIGKKIHPKNIKYPKKKKPKPKKSKVKEKTLNSDSPQEPLDEIVSRELENEITKLERLRRISVLPDDRPPDFEDLVLADNTDIHSSFFTNTAGDPRTRCDGHSIR